jgi:hypothetical protein
MTEKDAMRKCDALEPGLRSTIDDAGIRLCSHHVNMDSVVKATQSDAGSVQVAM